MHQSGTLAFSHYGQLLKRLSAAPFGDWSEPSVTAACAGEGWLLERPDDPLVTPVKTPAPLLGAWLRHAARPRGHFSSLDVTVGEHGVRRDRFWQYAAATTAHLGFGPQLAGGTGSGAVLGWRVPDRYPRVGHTHLLIRDGDALTLRLCPTGYYEADWMAAMRSACDADRWDPRFPRWLITRPDTGATGVPRPDGYLVDSWSAFERAVASTVVALGTALPVFDDAASLTLTDRGERPAARIDVDAAGTLTVAGPDGSRLADGVAADPAVAADAAARLTTTLIGSGAALPDPVRGTGLAVRAHYLSAAGEPLAHDDGFDVWSLGLPTRD